MLQVFWTFIPAGATRFHFAVRRAPVLRNLRFSNRLDPNHSQSWRVRCSLHRPKETLIEWATQTKQLNRRLREMPPLITGHLWQAQIEAIQNLDKSLAENRPRALIQMATGSGKTFTAVNFVYRLIKHAGARASFFW